MGQHDCSKVISKVYLALDGAMTEDEEKAFLADLEECSCCLDHFHIEKSFKDFLVEKVKYHSMKPTLRDSIRTQLSQVSGQA